MRINFLEHLKCSRALFLGALCLSSSPAVRADEVVLAGWHDFSSAFQAHRFLGSAKNSIGEVKNVSGVLYGGDGARNTWGSSDGTYGPNETIGSSATNGAMSIRVDKDKVFFTIKNNTKRNIHLSKIVFDFASVNGNSPRNLSVYYQSGDLSDPNETLLARWESILNGLGTVSNYEDKELDLSILEDQILAPGQDALFRFQADTANVNNQAMALDNIAILGDYADFMVVSYNIRGGKGSNDNSYNAANIRAFRDNFLQGEDVICLQEVDFLDGEWDGNGTGDQESIVSVLSDYPFTYQTINSQTAFFRFHKTSIAILSKHPLLNKDSHLVQIDPQADRWERHAQHVQVQVGQNLVNIFNFHNTFNFNENDFESEKEGLEKFESYVETRLGVNSVTQGERLIMLGDFNLFHQDVDEILPSTDRRSNGRDHICSIAHHSHDGFYTTGAAGADLSDHPAVWATLDLQAPTPDPITWASTPSSSNTGIITMEAAPASDPYEVDYYFTNTTVADGSHDSGWQSSPVYTDTGLSEGVNYTYTVRARDRSPNANMTLPSAAASATSTIAYLLPPYLESFENGPGSWVPSPGNDYDWTVHSGGTPTAAAGPSGASDGTFYLYAEGHDAPGSNRTASVEASFDFSALSAPAMQFDYHMYGTFIDYLALDVFDGTSWTNDVWLKDRPQHSGSDDPWSTATVDLTAYAGLSKVKLRFRTANLRWNAADPAVDRIQINERVTILYAQWVDTAFAGAPSGIDTSPNGNPDQDDQNNEAEWIFGTDPLVGDSTLKTLSESSGVMSFDYSRRKLADFQVLAQWSPDLTHSSWNTLGLNESVTADDGDIETVTVTMPMDLPAKFVRIAAEETE